MAKPKTAFKKCSKCSEPALEDRDICREHYAEYMREYRARDGKKRDADIHLRGFEEGLRKALDFLRKRVGSQAVTGLQAAVMVERAYLTPETPGVAERAKLIAQMMPWR